MISLLIIIILAWQFYIGYRRGLVLQSFYFLGSLISLFVAGIFYQNLAYYLYFWVPYASPSEGASTYFFSADKLFELDKVFYAGIGFLIVYILSYTVVRFIGVFLHFSDWKVLDMPYSKLAAGILSIIVTWIGFEMVATILATVPMVFVQEKLYNDVLVRWMINTPIVSQFLKSLWITKVLGG